MIVDQNMVAEAEICCQTSSISVLDVQYICVPREQNFLQVSTCLPKERQQPPIFREFQVPEISGSETETIMESTSTSFLPSICSGSHSEMGYRTSNEDEHVRVDDLSSSMGYLFGCKLPSSFYALFDGHGGADASAYLKENSMKLFFENIDLPQTSQINDEFLNKLAESHHEAFLSADQALSDKHVSPSSCGTTALTALILGSLLMVANAGDSRAVLSRKGVAVQLSRDHRPNNLAERKRVEDLGGFVECGYLNGELAVTRSLGDWYMKTTPFVSLPSSSSSYSSAAALTAEPEIQRIVLREDDEFLIMGCDGIWDVMSNQDAVSLVRWMLRRNGGDPKQCARELVKEALRVGSSDNLTAIVVCFSSPVRFERPRFTFSLSEESRNKLRSLLNGN